MAEGTLPKVGTKAVHKDDHQKQTGPVWQVKSVDPDHEKPVKLGHADHKLNASLEPEVKRVTGQEFDRDYVQL